MHLREYQQQIQKKCFHQQPLRWSTIRSFDPFLRSLFCWRNCLFSLTCKMCSMPTSFLGNRLVARAGWPPPPADLVRLRPPSLKRRLSCGLKCPRGGLIGLAGQASFLSRPSSSLQSIKAVVVDQVRMVTYDTPVDSALNGGGLGPTQYSILSANVKVFQD